MADGTVPTPGAQPPGWEARPDWRTPGPGQAQPSPTPAPANRPDSSAWWAQGAATDPWRDPSTTAVVRHTPPPMLPPTEPPLPPPPPARTGLGTIVLVAVLCSVFAGALSTAATLLIAEPGNGSFDSPGGNRPLGEYQDTIKDAMPSVVTIWAESDEGTGNGTGWVYSPEGYIVTNQHVAALAEGEGTKMSIQFSDGTMAKGEVVGAAKSTDIAVIKVDKTDLKALKVANSEELAVGDPVIAIGAPLGLSGTVTDGIVSALDRPVVSGEGESSSEPNTVMAGIQTDAAINPGNSGGPLLDASGQLVGVNTSIYSFANDKGEAGSMGLGFAIPSNQAARVAEELIDDGVATRPVLGTEMEATKVGETGAEVKSVGSKTPAADAGIKDGDVITKFNDTVITDDVQLAALVLKHAPGDSVDLTYERDGKSSETSVELGSAKDD
ncbi:S1C family serine protease [Stackebrandtia nassauensis]|uniref:Peptidase S1 and S6 chymotrypsin/Hap n=1 Tax=Stackebrandtia nassauensis (strain DSM 44728 / CIP 108903 / NRRL B-16338 / NBRC 102104 / LLR-40K-21) TaxID=446470 RepID=D3Q719_STANL|nr:trypsin-like peptidase domain-containing protein [Stackebrandtia nassauensis]ADD40418.1 peptidase S1 and S6 chymotrypsin/Hap [Stackebrandtia nassauensis DSM 44728]